VVEDLILAAIRDAQSRAPRLAQREAQKMAEGLGLPPA
jgi:nucleoid-associated protein EbfC